MKLRNLMLGAAIAAGALTVSMGAASAYVVCDRDGDDCWHTESRYSVPHVRFSWHNDDWYFHQRWDDRRHWRDHHEGRGYWRNGIWITF